MMKMGMMVMMVEDLMMMLQCCQYMEAHLKIGGGGVGGGNGGSLAGGGGSGGGVGTGGGSPAVGGGAGGSSGGSPGAGEGGGGPANAEDGGGNGDAAAAGVGVRQSARNNRGVPPIRFIEMYLAVAKKEAKKQSPHNYEEAVHSTHKVKWEQAMQSEMKSLRENRVYKLVNRPRGQIEVGL